MIKQIKYNRLIKSYLSKLVIQNNFNTGFIVRDNYKYVIYPVFSVDKISKKVYVHKEQILCEFGVLDDEIIVLLLKRYGIETYTLEKW